MKDNWFIEAPVLRKQYLSLSEEDKAQTRKAAIEMQKQLIFSEPWHLDGFSEKIKKHLWQIYPKNKLKICREDITNINLRIEKKVLDNGRRKTKSGSN